MLVFEIADVIADVLHVRPFVRPWNNVVCAVRLVGGDEVRVVDGSARLELLHVWLQLDLQRRGAILEFFRLTISSTMLKPKRCLLQWDPLHPPSPQFVSPDAQEFQLTPWMR